MALPPELENQIKEAIKDAEKRIKEIEPEIEKAKKAGIPAEDLEKELHQLKQQVANLKAVYFPGR
jgi:polyhydroxyalkanoate synthesis regulator phasin